MWPRETVYRYGGKLLDVCNENFASLSSDIAVTTLQNHLPVLWDDCSSSLVLRPLPHLISHTAAEKIDFSLQLHSRMWD